MRNVLSNTLFQHFFYVETTNFWLNEWVDKLNTPEKKVTILLEGIENSWQNCQLFVFFFFFFPDCSIIDHLQGQNIIFHLILPQKLGRQSLGYPQHLILDVSFFLRILFSFRYDSARFSKLRQKKEFALVFIQRF